LNLEALALGTFSGYRLPWAGGESRSLTQSVGHDRYTPSGNAHFAFDFSTGGYPRNIHASRSGVGRAPGGPRQTEIPPPQYYLVLATPLPHIPALFTF
jgi:hypothetical protein